MQKYGLYMSRFIFAVMVFGVVLGGCAQQTSVEAISRPASTPGVALVAPTPVSAPVARDEALVRAVPLPDPVDMTVNVAMTGFQEAIDRCAGPVLSRYETGDVIGEHNHCGGAPVLSLKVGDTVDVKGVINGSYVVSSTKVVPKVVSIDVLDFAPLYLQTCYFNSPTMRLVGLTPR